MKIAECPKCGEKELGKGKQTGMGSIIPNGKVSFGVEIDHIICSNCGFIIESYVKKPDKFKDTNY
ncbi:transcription initiation factor TFIIIB [Virgibacillus sp. MSJ-26]|uniref:transcription initiation factor TFIIIB n=1 Tax=Virgibacillus sp. MSJ-26 TaxID=2841522 RepID=UPI001C108D5D|nr:transcription initiation factor TFIIIB [Virgibacillus sp. MSJ-26]MBU5465844.1 transcription initiation factor TFIIIB [Virgibacillus sp. MSJ-26]